MFIKPRYGSFFHVPAPSAHAVAGNAAAPAPRTSQAVGTRPSGPCSSAASQAPPGRGAGSPGPRHGGQRAGPLARQSKVPALDVVEPSCVEKHNSFAWSGSLACRIVGLAAAVTLFQWPSTRIYPMFRGSQIRLRIAATAPLEANRMCSDDRASQQWRDSTALHLSFVDRANA